MGITGQCVQRHPSGKNLQLATILAPKYAMPPKLQFCADASICPALGGFASANMQALDA